MALQMGQQQKRSKKISSDNNNDSSFGVQSLQKIMFTTKGSPQQQLLLLQQDQQPAPVYITIGPPCAGKTQALKDCMQRDGYNPDAVLLSSPKQQQSSPSKSINNNNSNKATESPIDVALDEQSDVYHRIPLAAFIFPATRLDPSLGDTLLRSGTTVRDRLLDPSPPPLDQTDLELRNVILRVAGRLTPQEFANRTRTQALQAGDTVEFFRKRRLEVAEDLIQAVEQVAVQAVGEVLVQMQLQQPQQPKVVVEDAEQDLPYDNVPKDDDEDDPDDESNKVDLSTLVNATSAHLLSARALIKTPYVDIFVPQAIFYGGLDQAAQQLEQLLQSSPPHVPLSWGNTNTRPMEYAVALKAAQKAGRPVKFVAWGTPDLPRVSRGELLRRTVSKFRDTGRYIPAGAVGAALGRVERLMREAEKERQLLFGNHNNNNNNSVDDDDENSNSDRIDYRDVATMNDNDSDRKDELNRHDESAEIDSHQIHVALAALAGFVMDEEGFVTKIGEPRHLFKKSKNKNWKGEDNDALSRRQATPR